MKTIAVFFTSPGDKSYPFNESYYVTAYRELAEKIAEKGARLVIVRAMESYKGNGVFSGYWVFGNGEFTRINEDIKPDLVYNKGHFIFRDDDSLPIMNHRELDGICLDKRKTFAAFSEHCPLTKEVHSKEEALDFLEKVSTAFAVAKPIDGEEGKGVIIMRKNELADHIPSYPYLMQEFVDTSGGVPGITDGMHDLRLTLINGDVGNSFLRIPAKGKMVSNLAQGGSKQEVPVDLIPSECLSLAATIDERFKKYGKRVYSVDMGRDVSGKWFIIELNSQPGVTCRSEGPLSINFQNKLADVLLAS